MEKAFSAYHMRYAVAKSRAERTRVLNEFCKTGHYHRKYAIHLLNRPDDSEEGKSRRRRGVTYSPMALRVLEGIWKAAGYPWSERLKGLLPLWLPWARGRLPGLTPDVERQLLAISARQIDRRLRQKKRSLKRRLYGRTKPGTLLRREIPVKAGAWDVAEPGSAEIDLVSHSGPSATGQFGHTLNLTDIFLGWCESRAVLGAGQDGVVAALEAMRRSLPFPLRAVDSDNGSEFINHHLVDYCRWRKIAFTRSRPYKKDDNAHIEQKNWTHVRKVFGWERYDTPEIIAAMNDLYKNELRLMMNLFQPSVKLIERVRVGSRLTRRYDKARTPLDRLVAFYKGQPLPEAVRALLAQRQEINPFELTETIDRKLDRIERLRCAPLISRCERRAAPLSPQRGHQLLETTHVLR
ncbi:MAG: transposase family protein [Dehalococcoidia bacterium]|nr:transposase family protein [Dehalococcoidia bacterium]